MKTIVNEEHLVCNRVGSYVEVQRKEVPVDGKRRPSPFLGAW